MSEQLDHAYDLIKQGEAQGAIDVIEPLIRAEPDNEDAWWLLANATSETEAKRNALNNVLRLTSNTAREEKAQTMLAQLDADPYDFDVSTASTVGMSSYQETTHTKENSSGCGRFVLAVIGVVGTCALVSCIGIFWLTTMMFQMFAFPDTYEAMGTVVFEETVEGNLTTTDPIDGYTFVGNEGDMLEIELESDAEVAPFIILYDVETEEIMGLAQVDETFSILDANVLLVPEDGEYLLVIIGIDFLGQSVGYGDYTLTIYEQ